MPLFDELHPYGKFTRLAEAEGVFGDAILYYLKERELIEPDEVLRATQMLAHQDSGGKLDGVLVYAYVGGAASKLSLELQLQQAKEVGTMKIWSLPFKPEEFESLFGHLSGKLTTGE